MSPIAPSVRAGLNIGMLFWNRQQRGVYHQVSLTESGFLCQSLKPQSEISHIQIPDNWCIPPDSPCRPSSRQIQGCRSPSPVDGSPSRESSERPERRKITEMHIYSVRWRQDEGSVASQSVVHTPEFAAPPTSASRLVPSISPIYHSFHRASGGSQSWSQNETQECSSNDVSVCNPHFRWNFIN